jgi:tetratricopeptide (TPR) repeat protein
MEQSKNVPAGSTTAVTFEQAVQLAGRVSTLTRLDSVFAGLRIGFLKSGWPFKPGRMPRLTAADFTPQDYPEELALSMFLEEINWEAAHLKAALWYKGSNRIVEFEKEMAVLADYLPSADPYYMILIDGLLEKKNIVYAYPYILRMHRHHPGAYSAKWLGIYYLFMKDYQQAVSLLEYSAVLNAKDPQLHYNLAGAYVYTGDYGKALQTIEKCLAIQADFPGAAVMHRDLLRVANRKK